MSDEGTLCGIAFGGLARRDVDQRLTPVNRHPFGDLSVERNDSRHCGYNDGLVSLRCRNLPAGFNDLPERGGFDDAAFHACRFGFCGRENDFVFMRADAFFFVVVTFFLMVVPHFLLMIVLISLFMGMVVADGMRVGVFARSLFVLMGA